jgi:hypothetical protein
VPVAEFHLAFPYPDAAVIELPRWQQPDSRTRNALIRSPRGPGEREGVEMAPDIPGPGEFVLTTLEDQSPAVCRGGSHASCISRSVNECGEKVMSTFAPSRSRLALCTLTASGRNMVLTASGPCPVT